MRTAYTVAMAFFLLPALAGSLEPSRQDIAHAAETCTADGAFGIRFGDKPEPLETATGISPFRLKSLRATRQGGVSAIAAEASFAKAQMSQEDRVAVASWVLHAIDAEIRSTRRFARRDAGDGRIRYLFDNYALVLSRDGTEVLLACARAGPGG